MSQTIIQAILNIIIPPVCQLCSGITNDCLCADCRQNINFISDRVCKICGLPFISKESSPHLCSVCIKKRPSFSMARSIAVYDGVLRDAVHRLKYNGKTSLAKPLGLIMADRLPPNNYDLIVPVPLHRKRLKDRGFNQSLLLAKGIAKRHNIPIDYLNLTRTRFTEPQVNLQGKERFKNVRGAFAIKDISIFKDKSILLVDDVYTTGATVLECAKVLKKAGVKDAFVLTLARVTRDSSLKLKFKTT